jgi:hypothetical protein
MNAESAPGEGRLPKRTSRCRQHNRGRGVNTLALEWVDVALEVEELALYYRDLADERDKRNREL